MSSDEKNTVTSSSIKVVVKLSGKNAEPQSLHYTDKNGKGWQATFREGNSLSRAVALLLVLYRCLNAPILFRVSSNPQLNNKSKTLAPSKKSIRGNNPISLILNSHSDIANAKLQIHQLGDKFDDNLLRYFKKARGTNQPALTFETTRCSPTEICIKWDEIVITDLAKLKKLAAKIAANATPPWEIADYNFEATESPKPELIDAVPTSSAAQEPTIPPKIQKLLDQAEKLTEGDEYAAAVPILEKALEAAISAKHAIAESKVRTLLATAIFSANENFTSSEGHFRKALELFGPEISISRYSALHGLGDMLLAAGRLDEANAVIRSSLDVAKSLDNQDSVARSLISMSQVEISLGNGIEATARLDEAILILHRLSIGLNGKERINNAHALGVCYSNKAELARKVGRPDEALSHFSKAMEQYEVSNDKLYSGQAHLSIGHLYCGNGDFEEGFQSFKCAMAIFLELKNPLWKARAARSFAELYAQHERWDEAAEASIAAMHGLEEAKDTGERIEAILYAAKICARYLQWKHRKSVQKQIHKIFRETPKQLEDSVAAELSAQIDRAHGEIDEKVRTDDEIGRLLQKAKELAEQEGCYELLADCYLAEASLRTANDDSNARKPSLEQAIEELQEALLKTSIPMRKVHLMRRIGALCHELGRKSEWATWVKRGGEVLEKTGDVRGIAEHLGDMAAIHRSNDRLDEQIASYRKVLALIEGRTLPDLAAMVRVQLAEAIRITGDFGKALHLLTEAEDICKAHHMKGLISEIGRLRTRIEGEVEASQAPSQSLPQLLCSLQQLVRYKPEDATSYLVFWYYAWNKELLALLRSGSGLSLLLVTDEVERFVAFAGRFANLADHFALATISEVTVAASSKLLELPLRWRMPASIPMLFLRRKDDKDNDDADAESDDPPEYNFKGPARQLGPYFFRMGHHGKPVVNVMVTPQISAVAIELMLRYPIKDLIRHRAVCFPYLRHTSDDPFLTDLQIGRGHGLFPTYFDRLPTSKRIAVIGTTSIRVSQGFLAEPPPENISKWKRSLLKLTRLPKAEANVALLDLADSFPPAKKDGEITITFEVHLFEFPELDQMVIHPVLLFRDQ